LIFYFFIFLLINCSAHQGGPTIERGRCTNASKHVKSLRVCCTCEATWLRACIWWLWPPQAWMWLASLAILFIYLFIIYFIFITYELTIISLFYIKLTTCLIIIIILTTVTRTQAKRVFHNMGASQSWCDGEYDIIFAKYRAALSRNAVCVD
jgi:hypothetical protein